MNYEQEVKERLSKERVFVHLDQALEHSLHLMKNGRECTSVFETKIGQYACIHTVNAEMAIRYGYKLIYGEYEIFRASLSDKPAKEAIEEFRNRKK